MVLLIFGGYALVTSRRTAIMSERLRHANELAHLHAKAEKILESIPTGVMVLSANDIVTATNKVLRLRLPITATGSHFALAFPKAPPETIQQIRMLIHKVRAKRHTYRLRGKKLAIFGQEGPFRIHAVPLEPHFPEADLFLVVEDYTAIHALETQLLHAEKLTTVGILAAGMAHEIGNPLGVVRGRAEYLLGKQTADSRQTESLQIIIEQIDQVTRIVQELLDFSRVERANVASLPIASMVQKVVDLLQYELGRRHITVEIRLPDSLPPIAANVNQLQQVFVNLLLNACNACSDHGRIVITATEGLGDEEDTISSWDHVRIDIEDNGCGIAPENLHRVFDPFFTTNKRGHGTGLGLAIVNQIVRNHGALIDLHSELGHGTRVTLLWPIMKDQNQQQGVRCVG